MSWLDSFTLKKTDFWKVGSGLSRPECIIAEQLGTLWISDNKSAVMCLDPVGTQMRLGNVGGNPNGLAMDLDGNIFIANVTTGRVDKLYRDGHHEDILNAVDGNPILEACNFTYFDDSGRLWVTVSTRTRPRNLAIENSITDGYIILMDVDGPRIVADHLMFANEVRIDSAGEYLYVAETTGGRITRFRISKNGDLYNREVYGPDPLFQDARIDGICFDAEGNLWITELTRNALLILSAGGQVKTVAEDPAGETLLLPTSVTFGGPDLSIGYIGSLKLDHLLAFHSPVAGQALYHW